MLAHSVAVEVEAAVVVADDFYAGRRDEDWLSHSPRDRVDKVLDWRRLRSEALEPLLARRPATWHPLDFEPGVGWIGWKRETVTVEPADVVLVDGAYSARPELSDLIDLVVLIEAPEAIRRSRLRDREGEHVIQSWHSLWDAAEDIYFSEIRPPAWFDLVLQGT